MVCYDINRSVPLSPQERAIRKGCSFCVCDPGSHVLSVASLYESAPSGRARIPLSLELLRCSRFSLSLLSKGNNKLPSNGITLS